MAREYGFESLLPMKREATPGTPATGNYVGMPYYSNTLGDPRPKIKDSLAGLGRDRRDPDQDAKNIGGNVVVPLDMRYFGHWLTMLLGNPDSTEDAGVYTHEFVSGAAALPAYTIEKHFKKAQEYKRLSGLYANNMSLSMQRAGPVKVTFDLIGMTSTAWAGTSSAGTLQSLTLARANHFTGVLKKDDAVLGNVTGFDMNYTNNLVTGETVNNSGDLEFIDPGADSEATGSLTMRFANADLLDEAAAETPCELLLSYEIDEDLSMSILLPRVFLEEASVPVEGPGGISVTIPWHAVYDSVAGAAMAVTLINDLAGTIYTS